MSAVVLLVASLGPAHARSDVFIAPPRTIADITTILDQEKPDPEQIAKMRADADASPPQTADATSLVDFYYDRGVARRNIGRFRDSIADLKIGIAIGRQHVAKPRPTLTKSSEARSPATCRLSNRQSSSWSLI